MVDVDEPWRLARGIEGGYSPPPTPYAYLGALHLVERVSGGAYPAAVRILHAALSVALLGLLLDTARRLGASAGAIFLFLPAFLPPRLWHEYLLVKEYLPGALLLCLYGRSRLGVGPALSPAVEAALILASAALSPVAAAHALYLAVATRRGPALRRVAAVAVPGSLVLLAATAYLVPAFDADMLPLGFWNLPRELFYYCGGWEELPLPAPKPLRLGLYFAALAAALWAFLADGSARRVLLLGAGPLLAYPFLMPWIGSASSVPLFLRYLLFYSWFWIPVGFSLAPRRAFPAAAFFLLAATNWIPRLANAPETPSYRETIRSVPVEGPPLVFTDQMHRLTAYVAGRKERLVLADGTQVIHAVLDPERDVAGAYRVGNEVPFDDLVPRPESARILLLDRPVTRAAYERRIRGLGGEVLGEEKAGRTGVVWRVRFYRPGEIGDTAVSR